MTKKIKQKPPQLLQVQLLQVLQLVEGVEEDAEEVVVGAVIRV
jgi:hypothetical protein